jgi:hypothetical protein
MDFHHFNMIVHSQHGLVSTISVSPVPTQKQWVEAVLPGAPVPTAPAGLPACSETRSIYMTGWQTVIGDEAPWSIGWQPISRATGIFSRSNMLNPLKRMLHGFCIFLQMKFFFFTME